MNFGSCFGKVLLGFAGVSVAVCAYKFYSSNKNKKVHSSNEEDVVPNEPAIVKLDGMFMFYAETFPTKPFMTPTHTDMEVVANNVFMTREDCTKLVVQTINFYEQNLSSDRNNFSSFSDSSLRYEKSI